jgi:biotin carboxyl carrier protein
VRQAWLDFAAALAEVAADFHAWEELRRLRGAAATRRQAIDLVRRVQSPRDLKTAAFEAANEARRLLGCQRASVVIRRGGRWRLVAASGVDRVERSTDFARRSEELARDVARWGEAIDYSTQPAASPLAARDADLPPRLQDAIEKHIDHSHARRLVAAPLTFPSGPLSSAPQSFPSGPLPSAGRAGEGRRTTVDAVVLAERFDSAGDDAFRDQVVEIADLCAPALARAAELDRFPVRTLLRWSDRWQTIREPRRGARALVIAATIAAVAAALALIPADFDVEAPATLAAAVERQVFATATGAVAEVRVSHGDMVELGQTLIVLRDPELALKLQEVRGEIDATRKRLEAIAVARTERTLREDQDDQRLPLSAEQRELEEQLATLQLQAKLLEARRNDLEIRSPVAGQVLTRDVHSLLASRPVERGQVLLTIADSSAGWELRADVPQRKIGHVVAARQEQSESLAADYRLAGDVSRSYPGRVVAVSAAAPLDADGLQDDAAPVEVRIALVGDPPPAARSGMTANVRIHCGRRSLAYVWLHDPAATLYRWFTF